MSDHRFSSRTFNNSNSIRNNTNAPNFRFDNHYNQGNRIEQYMPNTNDDWDSEIAEAPTRQWSQSFDRNDDHPPRSFQDSGRPSTNFNRCSEDHAGKGFSRDYLFNSNDIPRLIGKGGANIQQIQREQNVQIQISNDRQSQWVDLKICGSNDQTISQAFNHIQNLIGNTKEKNTFNQPSTSTFHSNNSSLSPSMNTNGNFVRNSNNSFSSTNQNYGRNDRTEFSSRGRGYTGNSTSSRNTNEYGASRSTYGKSASRRCTAAGDENDDYDAFFGSDDETFNKRSHEDDKYTMALAFAPSTSSSNVTHVDTTKRVDWAKMRRTDTSNDMSKWKDFPAVIKEFYDELPDIAEMSSEDVQALRGEKNNIVVSWFDQSMKADFEQKNNCQLTIPNPIYEFAHAFHNYPEIMNEIAKQGFTEPSPIQCQTWPVALRGHDFIGIAQTGTGKTLAFLLPALIHIDNQPKVRAVSNGPKALVLSPTRELAIQIHQEVQKYSYRGIRSAVIYGGSSRKNQISLCETGVEIIIATPGRLNDLIMSNVIDVRSVTFLVLDEADRMLDMGFEPQIMKILLDIRPDRQTIMTSATWPEDVRRIAARYMRNPIQVYIGTLDLAAVHSVRQEIEIVREEEKFNVLLEFIGQMDSEDKAIIFVDRKASADSIASELIRKHISCQSIHGDREQSDREQALEDLKLGTVKLLIATDVASRGLDIQDITVVFNYDLPKSMEDYVHRVGRTGRAGKTGHAISLVTRENWASAGRLIKILEEAGQNVPGQLREMAARFQVVRDQRRDFGGGQNRYGNRDNTGGGRFFGLGSTHSRGEGLHGHDREKLPVMNSGWSFSS